MYQSSWSVRLDASAADVWQLVGDFHGLCRFHPLIRTTRRENHGLWRRDMFKDLDAGSLEERLHFSDRTMCYSYRSLNAGGGFWPIDSYFGKLKVWDRGDGTAGALWAAQLIPRDCTDRATNEAMVPQMNENESRGLGGLVEHFGGEQTGPLPADLAAVCIAQLDADPDEVWALVGNFFAIGEWVSNAARVERISNGRRFVHIAGRDQIDVEDEIFRDDALRTYSYRSTLEPGSAYPCDDYIAHLKVWPLSDGGSGVVWSGQFTPHDPGDLDTCRRVAQMMSDEYAGGIERLVRRFGGAITQ